MINSSGFRRTECWRKVVCGKDCRTLPPHFWCFLSSRRSIVITCLASHLISTWVVKGVILINISEFELTKINWETFSLNFWDWEERERAWSSAFIGVELGGLGFWGLTQGVSLKFKNGTLKHEKTENKQPKTVSYLNQSRSVKQRKQVWPTSLFSSVLGNMFIPDSHLWSGLSWQSTLT